MTPLKLIFMGTAEFARVILQGLHEAHHKIECVFSQPDKPVGRGQKIQSPAVALCAKALGLRLHQPASLKGAAVASEIKSLSPDFVIVASYGKILPNNLLAAAGHKVLNVHASLLPKYRGAAPIHYALLKGETQTGISIMQIVPEMDAGPVYLTKTLTILPEDNAITLSERLSLLGVEAILDVLEKIPKGLKPKEQAHEQATYAPKLTKDLSPIDWLHANQELFNQVRALVPWPVAETSFKGRRLKVFSSKALNENSAVSPGTITHLGQLGITVQCGEGSLLIAELQLEGKKRMKAFDLANGLRLKGGERFSPCLKNS